MYIEGYIGKSTVNTITTLKKEIPEFRYVNVFGLLRSFAHKRLGKGWKKFWSVLRDGSRFR
jgi:hypothetical protein